MLIMVGMAAVVGLAEVAGWNLDLAGFCYSSKSGPFAGT